MHVLHGPSKLDSNQLHYLCGAAVPS
jgi:hypothetical protein